MFGTHIVDIDLTMSLAKFESELLDEIHNYSATMTYKVNPGTTKRGKSMYKVVVENNNKSTFTLIAEQDTNNGNIIFYPLTLQSVSNSFYQAYYNDSSIIGTANDPAVFTCQAIFNIARANNGTFAFIDSDGSTGIVLNGQVKSIHSIGLVDESGNTYFCSNSARVRIDEDDEDNDCNITIIQPFSEWLEQHEDVQKAIAILPTIHDKANYVGKWLIQERINDNIKSSEFIDIFRQFGFMFGYSDSSLANIYKLIN